MMYRLRVWLGSLAWYVRSKPQDTRVFHAPRVLPPREPWVLRHTPCREGDCDICDERRDQRWAWQEEHS